MATMDIFEGDAFSIIELTRALENIPYKPATLSGSGLFGPRGVRSRTVVIESRDGTLSLIPFSERGSAYDQQTPERRDVRAFVCRQFKKQDVIWASEIQQVRDFGSDTATQQVQAEVARKLGRLRNDAETTFEYHLFNGIQGLVKDPRDGATVVNYFTEFGITPATEVDFDLDNATPASGALRKRCQALIESVEDTMGGLATGAIALRARQAALPSSLIWWPTRRSAKPTSTPPPPPICGRVSLTRSASAASPSAVTGAARALVWRLTRRCSIPKRSTGSLRFTTPPPTPSRR